MRTRVVAAVVVSAAEKAVHTVAFPTQPTKDQGKLVGFVNCLQPTGLGTLRTYLPDRGLTMITEVVVHPGRRSLHLASVIRRL